jgi:hypothetical protein
LRWLVSDQSNKRAKNHILGTQKRDVPLGGSFRSGSTILIFMTAAHCGHTGSCLLWANSGHQPSNAMPPTAKPSFVAVKIRYACKLLWPIIESASDARR